MQHAFKVGQMLDLSSSPMHSNRPKGPCTVLACLPHDKGPVLYRVQCQGERYERVVDELDLSSSSQSAPQTKAKNDNIISIAISRR